MNIMSLSTNLGSLMLNVNNLFIQYNDQAIACEVQTMIQQFAARTQTVSGLSNWIFTIAYGTFYPLLQSYLSTYLPSNGNQEMYTSVMSVFDQLYTFFTVATPMNCQQLGYMVGLWVSDSLQAKVDTSVAVIAVQGI